MSGTSIFGFDALVETDGNVFALEQWIRFRGIVALFGSRRFVATLGPKEFILRGFTLSRFREDSTDRGGIRAVWRRESMGSSDFEFELTLDTIRERVTNTEVWGAPSPPAAALFIPVRIESARTDAGRSIRLTTRGDNWAIQVMKLIDLRGQQVFSNEELVELSSGFTSSLRSALRELPSLRSFVGTDMDPGLLTTVEIPLPVGSGAIRFTDVDFRAVPHSPTSDRGSFVIAAVADRLPGAPSRIPPPTALAVTRSSLRSGSMPLQARVRLSNEFLVTAVANSVLGLFQGVPAGSIRHPGDLVGTPSGGFPCRIAVASGGPAMPLPPGAIPMCPGGTGMGRVPETRDARLRRLTIRVENPLVVAGIQRFAGQVVRIDVGFTLFTDGFEARADVVLGLGFDPSMCRTADGTRSSISPANRIAPIIAIQLGFPSWAIALLVVFGVIAIVGFVVAGAGAAAASAAATLAGPILVAIGAAGLFITAVLGGILTGVADGLVRQGIEGSFSDLSNLAIPLPDEIRQVLGSAAIDRIDFDDLDAHLCFPTGEYDTSWLRGEHTLSPGTAFDLDAGQEYRVSSVGMLPPSTDLTWAIDGLPVLRTSNLADLVVLGRVSEASVHFDQLRRARFGQGGEIPASRIPQFVLPPPTAGPPQLVPLVLAVRTNEQRLARCAVWRDSSAGLHLRYTVFDTHTPSAWIVRAFSVTERRLVSQGRGDAFTGDWREFAVGRRLAFSPGTRLLAPPLRVEWSWNDVVRVGRGTLSAHVSFEESGLNLVITSVVAAPIRGVLAMRVIDAHGQDIVERISIDLPGTEREVSRSALEQRLVAIQEQVVSLMSSPFRLPLTPQPDPSPFQLDASVALVQSSNPAPNAAIDPSVVVSASGLPWLDPRASKRR